VVVLGWRISDKTILVIKMGFVYVRLRVLYIYVRE
jgi:hypothetical protein